MNDAQHIKIQKLRECPEFSDLDDESAQMVIDSIREFCNITVNEFNTFNVDNGQNANIEG
jgi:hypothetical protein